MLNLQIPALTETVTLSGVTVTVHQLPLFFLEQLPAAYAIPEEKGPERTTRLFKSAGIEVVEALGQAKALGGRPDWKDGAEAWDAYADKCTAALKTANFTSAHYKVIQEAIKRLEDRQMESLEQAGNA